MNPTFRMTDRSRRVMALAQTEALNHAAPAIEPEHVLVGLVLEGRGVAAYILRALGVEVAQVRQVMPIDESIQPCNNPTELPWSDQTQNLVNAAYVGAQALNHNYIGTEHLVMALVHVTECRVPALLAQLGLKTDVVQKDVLQLLGHFPDTPSMHVHVPRP